MNLKHFFKYSVIDLVALTFAIIFSAYTAVYLNRIVGLVELIVVFIIMVAIVIYRLLSRKRIRGLVSKIAGTLDFSDELSINSFPLPVLVAGANNEIAWYNEQFLNDVISDSKISGNDVRQFISGLDVDKISSMQRADVAYKEKDYTVYCSATKYRHKDVYVLYFVDDTELKETAFIYEQTRPSIMFISIDGIDELSQSYKEGELTEIKSGVEKILEDWVLDYPCILRKFSSNRFMVICEEKDLREIIAKRFKILDIVRGYTYKDAAIGVTLSIGVGRGDSFLDCQNNAKQALDMALGRGGDQAAVKGRDLSYEFFGGISKSVERKTRVKARIIANAIKEIVKTGGDVYIMGHRYSDLDSLGSAIALCSAIRSLGENAHIVIDLKKTLAGTLVQMLKREGMSDMLLSPETAISRMGEDSTVIIVDTHIADFTESRKVYEKAANVIVIDHHRLVVNRIDNAVIFYHDPSTSSASEMVTELLQYMSSSPLIGKNEADALLAGIMLDTRNFVLRAGVRTFEAAAYLKKLGADTVKVKGLFSSSLNSFKLRNQIIINAQTFNNCAISVVSFNVPDLRIICAQAADEMLSIKGVDASFVLFESKGHINISARSFGAVNVQIIMEAFDGGGHQTMAAAQISTGETTMEAVLAKLQVTISDFFSNKG